MPVTFFYSYLKRHKQNVRINNTHSVFQILLSGVPQGLILGPLLFNMFINDLYLWVSKTDLLNFADDSTISASESTIEKLISTLEQDSQAAVDWFIIDEMIVNSDKFQAIVVKKNCRMKDSYALNINKQTINSENCVKLLGIEIHYLLTNISNLCKKASNQLNVIRRILKYLDFQEKEVLLNSFRLSNFNYCPLIWHFHSSKSLKKIEKIQEQALRILYNNSTSDYNQNSGETKASSYNKSIYLLQRFECSCTHFQAIIFFL